MKKSILFLGVAAVLASCSSGEYEEWANPQSSAQEAPQTVSFTATAASAIDFNNVTTDSVQLFVPSATASQAITSQNLFATLSSADGKATSVLNASDKGKVKASELQSAVETLYGKSSDVHQIPTVVTDTIRVNGVGYVRTASVTSTVNLVTPSYAEFLYEMGNESSWKEVHALRSANFDGKYEGFYYLNGEFKFKPNKDDWEGDYEYNGEGKLTQNGNQNIPDPGAGFYFITVDLGEGTYSLYKINQLSLIGDFNSWGGDVDLTYNVTDGAWEADNVVIPTSGNVKFRCNHKWNSDAESVPDFGGTADNLVKGGGNFNLEAGTYDIKVYLSYDGASHATFTKK